MRYSILLAPVFAAAEALSGAAAADPVAEIVTFRLNPDVTESQLVDAAKGTITYLDSTGAVISRSLSVDADGLWTDYILWTSMYAAKAAEELAVSRPEFGTFFSLMDENTVNLRHAPVRMRMD
ncbi:MAG: hypothetical protein GDA36_04220 [Rhodobacteraceae bacterium]|nr:hypothetical protein [Paracoccaceae bacterium]